ncbi:MAG: enoyl-CoA hydratase/isomerase family protein [Burkholderiaceae bacterium]|nr:enoyl-CoA hydratase/isomerase family protein [Burkholderiaceae bacterium]
MKCFTFSVAERIARLTLSRPDELNTINPDFWRELEMVLDNLQREAPARALVISSSGKHFSAGMALEMFGGSISINEASAASRANIAAVLADMQRVLDKLAALRMPVIAVIQGGCIGGGVDLVSACDLRYCSAEAFFCIQEINIGMTADLGTLQRLPKLIPDAVVRELAFTGRRLPAARALAVGLINEVAADADTALQAALATAGEIAAKPPVAIWGSKQAIDYARDHPVADSLRQMGWLQAAIWDTSAIAESMAARQQRRDPDYHDLAKLRFFGDED